MRTLILALCVVLGCNKDKPAPDDKAAAAGSASAKAEKVEQADEKPAPKKAKPEPPKKEPKKKADADKLAAYWKAMNDGRKATLAKNYEDAYAAFDKALVAMPDDARAISERGYAKLLAKDYKGAVADLDHAVTRTKDKKLLGQIYYNYGLAAEAKGDKAAAQAAFARSNEYNPTPAAKKKLTGQSTCTAIITAEPPSEPKTYASWKEAYEDARKDHDYLDAWKSEDATLATFCSNKWSKGASCVATLGQFMLTDSRLYVPTSAGKVAMFDLAYVGGRCGGQIDAKLVSDEGDVAHVSWKASQGISVLVTDKGGEIVPCGEKDTDCMSACGDDEVTFTDLFVAKDQGLSMLYVSREAEGEKDPLKLAVEMPVVKITGKGCDAERPLAR